MKKNRIKLNECMLRNMIRESVKRVLKESQGNNYSEAINHLTEAYRCLMQYNKNSIANGETNPELTNITKQIGNIIGQINNLQDPYDTKGQENLRQTGWSNELNEMTGQDFEDDFNTNLRDKHHDDALFNRQFNNEFDKNLAKSKTEKKYRDYQNKEFNKHFK